MPTTTTPYHICYGSTHRTRFLLNDAAAIRLGKRLATLGERLRVLPPAQSLAATMPWEVSVYRDTLVNGAWQYLVTPPVKIYRNSLVSRY